MREDTRILQSGVHVVVGTPGRVYDMLRRRALRADSIQMFVLDEADEMLSRGFKDQIYDIFQLLPPKLQVRKGRGGARRLSWFVGSFCRATWHAPIVNCPPLIPLLVAGWRVFCYLAA